MPKLCSDSISVPLNVVRQPWNACQYSQKLQLLSLFFSSISLLLFLVLSTRILELLLFSQQECFNSSYSLNKNASTTQEWVRPLAQVDLMREGEEFSNLTVEIRLDGSLRFGVSSLTLTLIIKSHFNLHLTN
jgi:hypothetical protein